MVGLVVVSLDDLDAVKHRQGAPARAVQRVAIAAAKSYRAISQIDGHAKIQIDGVEAFQARSSGPNIDCASHLRQKLNVLVQR